MSDTNTDGPLLPVSYASGREGVPPLTRRLVAEFLGTGLLVAVVVGSGIAAQRLSPTDTGLQLLQNSLTTVFGLGVLILVFGPVSGAHFNPVVSAVDWVVGRRSRTGLSGRDVLAYSVAQILGGIGGALLANLMFGLAAVQISQHVRAAPGLWVGELVATAGLIAVILTLARTGRASLSAASVAAWIGAAYWFTSSTSFANPAVTIGRMFSDTFAGIAPASAPMFVVFQILGAALGAGLALYLYPDIRAEADAVVVPHTGQTAATVDHRNHTAPTVERTTR
jgi:glycerol uptake facilitator-like aquaporin